jgi:hypothetical protein
MAVALTAAARVDFLGLRLRRRERITQAFADWPDADRAALGIILSDLGEVLADDRSRR